LNLDKSLAHVDLRQSFLTKNEKDLNWTNQFKNRLDKFWSNQDVMYNYKAELSGVGNRSSI